MEQHGHEEGNWKNFNLFKFQYSPIIVGTIVTLTESAKDKLRIRTDDDNEITLSLGSIDPVDLVQIRMGDRVSVKAERTLRHRAGKRTSEKLEGVSIEVLPKLPS